MPQLSDPARTVLQACGLETVVAAQRPAQAEAVADTQRAVEVAEASSAAWERYRETLLAGAPDETLLAAAERARSAYNFQAAIAAESRGRLDVIEEIIGWWASDDEDE